MGIGGISVGSLLLILLIVLLLFGTKKLRNVGTDLGGAIKGFRSAMKDGEQAGEEATSTDEDKPEGDPAQLSQAEDDASTKSGSEEQSRSKEHSS